MEGFRKGEELDVAAVDAWLKAKRPGLVGTPKASQYSGGASNWTYRLQYDSDDLVLRRAPKGTKAKSAHDMGREFRVQEALRPVYPYVPEMIAFCDDANVIGGDFYVMRRIPGLIPRASMPESVPRDAATIKKLCLNVIDKLIELHDVDIDAAGLSALGKGAGYARRQIEGWTERFNKANTWNVPRFKKVSDWLLANTPSDSAACLIHNDFRFDNVVLDPIESTRVVGVLDWEMATIGDPLMDLGNTLAYWIQADDDWFARSTRRQPTHLPGMLSRAEVIAYYCERRGLKPTNMAFYEVYGVYRLAGIVQQIYYRYHHKQTTNPAFKRFGVLATYLGWRCGRIIKRAGR
jgi:aminoglycoside phosphotransferase (APT) family kinase protein